MKFHSGFFMPYGFKHSINHLAYIIFAGTPISDLLLPGSNLLGNPNL